MLVLGERVVGFCCAGAALGCKKMVIKPIREMKSALFVGHFGESEICDWMYFLMSKNYDFLLAIPVRNVGFVRWVIWGNFTRFWD